MKSILAITALLTLSATSVMAATSGTLVLQGVVAKKISITVNSEDIASGLDLATVQSNLKVGTVTEQSNSSNGYKVTISSLNQGKLKRVSGLEVFAYTLKYGGAPVDLASGSVFSNSAASAGTIEKDLLISYAPVAAESMVSGSYTDTVTLQIASN